MQIPQLTFTRFLASISIVVLHFGLSTWPITNDFFFPVFEKSISAISYFFVLSGFILIVSSAKNGHIVDNIHTITFWRKRAARILPVYIFSVLLFFAINFEYQANIPLKWQIQSYVYSLFLLQSWKYKMALDINYPAWSLSVEAFFYLIFPLLYSKLISLTNKWLVLISILLWILNTCLFRYLIGENVPENFVKFFPLLHVATFITGICSGIFFIRNFDWINGKAKYLFIFTAIASMFIIYTSYKYFNFYHYQHNGLLSPFFILLFYSLAVMRGPIVKVFSTKSFVFLGDISYSIYLFQYPVLQICQKYIPGLMGRETKDIFFQYVFVLICFSSLTYLLIEKPFRIYFTKKVTNKTSLER